MQRAAGDVILKGKTEYAGIHGCPIDRPRAGERENRERSAILRQDRCCEVERGATGHWRKPRRQPRAMKLSQKTCLWKHVSWRGARPKAGASGPLGAGPGKSGLPGSSD